MDDVKKAEYMTSLRGNCLVSKTHRCIAFRGRIDTLQAEVIQAQVLAAAEGESEVCSHLGEILDYLRTIMSAEVTESPLSPPFLFGLDAETLHRQSHNTQDIFGKAVLPDYSQGSLAAAINSLRAKTREVELLAVSIFGPGSGGGEKPEPERPDIILALNRLSSALWWLFCKHVSKT